MVDHITNHFPQLVIPQAIERFNVAAANEVREWVMQTTTAILNSSEENYERECSKIEQIRSDLEGFLGISDERLTEPFKKASIELETKVSEGQLDKVDKVYCIQLAISYLKESSPYNNLGEKLIALYEWQTALAKARNQVLKAVVDSLSSGKINLEGTYLKKNANSLHINLLESNLSRLVALGYTASVADNGETMEAKNESEKTKLKQLNEELNLLAMHLSLVMRDVLRKVYQQELRRMHEAVTALFDCQISFLEEESNRIAADMVIKLPKSQLTLVEQPPEFSFNFQSGFEVTPGTWQEEVQVSYKERTWKTLFLFKETKYRTEYKERSSDNAKIPSVDELLKNWSDQAKASEDAIASQIADWLFEQIDTLKKNVNEFQKESINRYQERLDQANRDKILDRDKTMSIWLPMHEKAKKLAIEFSDFTEILR